MSLINIKSIEVYKDNQSYIDNKKLPLLSFNQSTKILKGSKLGYTTGILYLKPADSVASKTLCAYSSPFGCKDICLQDSGRLHMDSSQLAMYRRTINYLQDPDDFKDRLRKEIIKNQTDKYAIRLNGTSDIDWSDLISSLPDIQFYDYTKCLNRIKNNKLSNYHLTFSASFAGDKAIKHSKEAIKLGLNTAIAFNTKQCKDEFKIPKHITVAGTKVKIVSFDDTDLRFLDPDGSVGSLTRKGSRLSERLSQLGSKNFFADLINIKLLEEV